jgi:tetratricopeptide (TPR) repeat protein
VPRASSSRRRLAVAALVAAMAVGIVAGWVRPPLFFGSDPTPIFRERDWIMVADVNNLARDPVFDRSLRLALEVSLEQSTFVNVLPPDRAAAALRRLRAGPTADIDERTATEIAVREGVRAVLSCDITGHGSAYSLAARVIDPNGRGVVQSFAAQAPHKGAVIDAIGDLARQVRGALGEPLPASGAAPLSKMTTASLDALKLYADALQDGDSAARVQSDELLRRAIALDPDFALAHGELGRRYYVAGGPEAREAAEQHFEKALALVERLSARNWLRISAIANDAREDRERAIAGYEAWLAHYPDDTHACARLSAIWMTSAEYGKAIEGFTRVLQIDPRDASSSVRLAGAHAAIGDVQNALSAYQKAFDITPSLLYETPINHEYGFTLVGAGRIEEAASLFDRMKTTAEPPGSRARGFRSAALLEMYRGRYAAATDQLRQAIGMDRAHSQYMSELRDRLLLVTALEARGQRAAATSEWIDVSGLVAKLPLGPDWLSRLVRMRARTGHLEDAGRLLDRMLSAANQRADADATARTAALERAYIDLARAEVDLASGRPDRAIELVEPAHRALESAESLEALARASAIAGRLDLAAGRYEQAVQSAAPGTEAQQGWQQAHVELGRLYERLGRPRDAFRIYTALADRWKDGDADVTLLIVARGRLEQLGAASR